MRRIALWYKHLTQCFWCLYADVYFNSSALLMFMSNKMNSNVHLLCRNVSRKNIWFIVTSKLTSMLLSSAATALSVWWIESTSAEITLLCWQHLKIQALYTWHFSTFNQYVLLSTTIYYKMKTLGVHAACKWYISPNHSAIKPSGLNSKKFLWNMRIWACNVIAAE